MITDPKLRERQLLSDADFLPHFLELVANFPPREFTQESFERGLRYPWTRAPGSYTLRGGEVGPIAPDAAQGRHPLLAFGSNAAPRNLAIKLDHLDDSEVHVLAGELAEFDVVAAAAVALYGAMPATLAPSPGTSVSAAVLLVTPPQLEALTWGEMPYRLGRLRGATFTSDDGELTSPLAYISRWGAFAPEGEPVALAAVPARGRRFAARTQTELLDRAAAIVFGEDGGGAEAISRAVHAGMGDFSARALSALAGFAQPFAWDGWEPVVID